MAEHYRTSFLDQGSEIGINFVDSAGHRAGRLESFAGAAAQSEPSMAYGAATRAT
jgi:hypothetical protein